MIALVRAEFIKLRTTQVWFWLLLAILAISAAITIGACASHNSIQNSHDFAELIMASQIAFIVVFVLGILGVTTEFRYQTITPTVLATPSRWALVTAKMITYTILGAAYALASLAIQLAIAVPWLRAKGVDFSLSESQVPRAMILVFCVVAIYGIVGLGWGALLRNQIVAVTVGIIFLLAIQHLILAIPGLKHIYPYLPDGATQAILHLHGDDTSFNGVTLLQLPAGFIVLLLWAFIPAILGAGITMNRDIT